MFTKFDEDMYKTLKFIESYQTNDLIKFDVKNNVRGPENYINHVFDQLIKNNYIEGIKVVPTMDNDKRLKISKNIFITGKGYAFMKKYKYRWWTTAKTILIVIVSTLITVSINNWFSGKSEDCICNYVSQPNS